MKTLIKVVLLGIVALGLAACQPPATTNINTNLNTNTNAASKAAAPTADAAYGNG